MNLKIISTQIIKDIHRLDNKSKLIIGVDGYSGMGKTTLLNHLQNTDRALLTVNLDDFILPRRKRDKILSLSRDKSKAIELQWYNLNKIKRLIAAFKKTRKGRYIEGVYDAETDKYSLKKTYDFSKRFLIIEGVFLYHPKVLNNIFDKRFYLDGNVKLADARRRAREKKKWGKRYFPETNPNSYSRLFKKAYVRYISKYRPQKTADRVFYVD
jgi:uridine kinase